MAAPYSSSRQSDLEKVSNFVERKQQQPKSKKKEINFVFEICLFEYSDMVGTGKWHQANFCPRTKSNQNTIHGLIYVSLQKSFGEILIFELILSGVRGVRVC